MNTLFPKFTKTRDGLNVIMEQKLLKQVSNLVLNVEKCTGCGICSEACPEEAISLGPVGASRRGAIDSVAPVDIDETECSYCGVCVLMCPFNALSLKVDGEEKIPLKEQEGFPEYDMVTKIDDEKCVRCTICDDVCPRDAIVRDVPTFEGESSEGLKKAAAIKTKIEFSCDDEKCSLCGLCGAICPAIDVKKKAFSPESGKPEGEVVWEESLCDGCQICVEVCPEEALKVEREFVSKMVDGKVEIDQDDCVTCRWCAVNCPTEAITVEKIFEGEIEFYPEKCPGGCSTCVDVCPCNAIYLPSPLPADQMKGQIEPNIAVNKDFCILCGACVNACPGEDIIVLKRTGVRVKGEKTDLFKRIEEKLLQPRTSKVKESVAPGEVELKVIEEA